MPVNIVIENLTDKYCREIMEYLGKRFSIPSFQNDIQSITFCEDKIIYHMKGEEVNNEKSS